MSRINYGSIDVELADGKVTLYPTLNAMQKINRHFGSVRAAAERVYQMDFDAICYIVSAASDMSKQEAKDIPERVFQKGLSDVTAPVVEYLTKLMNPSGQEAEESEGKEQA